MNQVEDTADIRLASRSAAKRMNRLAIDVCICTYRRPAIVEALKAVAAQDARESVTLRVIVADNAPDTDARALICAAGESLDLDLVYVHAPAKNISIARNACLATARAEWLAFLDDDECPAPNWLTALIAEAQRGDWDAVLGPVQAVYPERAPAWLRICDLHSTRPVWVDGRIETGYTGNVLLRRESIERTGLGFQTELGRSGGEDIDFFYRLRDAGGRIGYTPDALIYEPVPIERTNLGYLLRRNFRRGQTHGRRLMQSPLPRSAFHLPLAIAKVFLLGLAACQPRTATRNRYLTRAALHCGVVARLAGVAEIKLY
ncbi:MAG TPA: glycosyltransferase [Stellaceae bacterium]|nr:glycosyltransferase [Stellaceae bacterium]